MLIKQIATIALGAIVVFSFAFGLVRVSDPSMEPRFQDGDPILFHRLDKRYGAQDVAVFEREGRPTTACVIAEGGDTVTIDSHDLIVTGSYQQEPGITDDTTQVPDGVTFPSRYPMALSPCSSATRTRQ